MDEAVGGEGVMPAGKQQQQSSSSSLCGTQLRRSRGAFVHLPWSGMPLTGCARVFLPPCPAGEPF